MTDDAKIKTKFRASAKWKKFRAWMKKTYKVDAVTGKPLYKGWNLHHCDLNPKHYTDISNPDHFSCLNKTSHEIVHWLYRYDNWEDILENIKCVLYKMQDLNCYGDNE